MKLTLTIEFQDVTENLPNAFDPCIAIVDGDVFYRSLQLDEGGNWFWTEYNDHHDDFKEYIKTYEHLTHWAPLPTKVDGIDRRVMVSQSTTTSSSSSV